MLSVYVQMVHSISLDYHFGKVYRLKYHAIVQLLVASLGINPN